jgi:hypothetical protein
MSSAASVSLAWRMVAQSDWLPMMMATGGKTLDACDTWLWLGKWGRQRV